VSNPPPQFQPDPTAPRPRRPAPDPVAPETAAAPPAPSPLPRPTGRDAWPPWLSIAAFAAGYGATIVFGIIVITLSGAFGASTSHPPAGVNIGLTVVQNVALIAAAYFFAALSCRPSASDFGLRQPTASIRRSVGLLIAVWIVFFVASAIWALVLGLDETQTLPDDLGANGPLVNALAVVVLVTVIAPLGEELFFRGFFFGALRNWRGWLVGATLTGALFGLIHVGSAPVGYLVPLAFFGFGLCLLYERTGSLYPSIALHALNNSIALGANLNWSWQIPAMMVGSTLGALGCAWLLARLVGERVPAAPASAPVPGAT
jgi:membrane protease YdiL (CAAX protease family)